MRDTKNFEAELFLEELSKSLHLLGETNLPININEIDIHTDKFINIFQLILDKHAPLRKRSRKELKLKTKPCITKGLLKSIHRKNCMYKKCGNSKCTAKWDEYKMYRNKLTYLKNSAKNCITKIKKKLYYQDIIRKNKQNTAKLWKTINDIFNVSKRRGNNIPDKMTTGTEDYAYGNRCVSNMLNNYFTNVGINLAAKISKSVQCNFNITSLIHSNINSIFIQPIAEDEIRMHIRGLDSSKSTGIDGIPIKYIKMAATVITPKLTQLFNICIKKGYFPQALKIAEIVPIFKKGNRENCCNYRPISILSPFAKIFEKCLHEQ